MKMFMDDKISWGRYDFYSGEAVFNDLRCGIDNFDFCGMVFRLKYNHQTNDFDIRKKAEVEAIACERGADVVLRPPRGTRRKDLQGRYFLIRKR